MCSQEKDVVHRLQPICLAPCLLLAFALPSCPKDSDKKWQAQDSWQRYSDRELTGDFKLTRPKVEPKGDCLLLPVLSRKPQPDEPGKAYVILPGSDAQEARPNVQVETTYVP